jgi:hypothetical protein
VRDPDRSTMLTLTIAQFHLACLKHIQFQSNTPIYLLSIMHIATCFDCNESSSGYPTNHKIDISSGIARLGTPDVYVGS